MTPCLNVPPRRCGDGAASELRAGWSGAAAGPGARLRRIMMSLSFYFINHSATQLSPGIILMSGGAHDGGILQSSLFTSRSQNQVSGKLRSWGFWS